MKIPRLNRRWRIVRNLAAAAVLAVLLWAYAGFPAPTEGLALKWEAERYFTEPGEVVLRVDQTGGAGAPLKWFADRKSVLTYRDGYLTAYQYDRFFMGHTMDYQGVYPIVEGRCVVEFTGEWPEKEFHEAQVEIGGQTVTVWVERMA